MPANTVESLEALLNPSSSPQPNDIVPLVLATRDEVLAETVLAELHEAAPEDQVRFRDRVKALAKAVMRTISSTMGNAIVLLIALAILSLAKRAVGWCGVPLP